MSRRKGTESATAVAASCFLERATDAIRGIGGRRLFGVGAEGSLRPSCHTETGQGMIVKAVQGALRFGASRLAGGPRLVPITERLLRVLGLGGTSNG
jgi:hypothetical protein